MQKTSPATRTGPEDVPGEADTPPAGELDLALRVLVALIFGLALGLEREIRGNPAGLRTMGLVTAGACLFTGLGLISIAGKTVDPTRVAAQVVTGIGFLGAGAILRQGLDVKGLTTAASIWTAAAIGMAVGFGYFLTAAATTVLVLITLIGLRWVEDRFFPAKHDRRAGDRKSEPAEP